MSVKSVVSAKERLEVRMEQENDSDETIAHLRVATRRWEEAKWKAVEDISNSPQRGLLAQFILPLACTLNGPLEVQIVRWALSMSW